jgi:DNA-binding HxlR family transcriptional regulator
MTQPGAQRSRCPIAISLDIFGDRWSLLIVRDLLFQGATTFRDFQGAEEKIATNILADRLERLARNGIIEARPDPADGRKKRYRLTAKGRELGPVLCEIVQWSARHHDTAAPPEFVKAMAQDRDGFLRGLAGEE